MNDYSQPEYPGGRIFHTYRRWPLVPTQDLQKLREALMQCMAAAGSEPAEELLGLVEDELTRRHTHPPVTFPVAERNRRHYKVPDHRRVRRTSNSQGLSG